ncbi:hypothetical protein MFUL124B02_02960 [Myxococcus fulvus 124B02]|nr:hypothetical protein MFUL124B02_02960 [Myxococcus fulvus 124B02]
MVWLRPTLVASSRAGSRGHERDTTTEPELSVTDADVPTAQWQQFLDEAEGLRVPAFQFGDFTVGTDGAVYGVEQKSFRRTLRFEWWWKPPAGWEEFADWVSRVTAFFEENLGGPVSADEPRK